VLDFRISRIAMSHAAAATLDRVAGHAERLEAQSVPASA
jgi:hypothetical protein